MCEVLPVEGARGQGQYQSNSQGKLAWKWRWPRLNGDPTIICQRAGVSSARSHQEKRWYVRYHSDRGNAKESAEESTSIGPSASTEDGREPGLRGGSRREAAPEVNASFGKVCFHLKYKGLQRK